MENKSIRDFFYENFTKNPSRVLIASEERKISFQELHSSFSAFSKKILVDKNTCVLVYAKHSIEVATLLAYLLVEKIPYLYVSSDVKKTDILELLENQSFSYFFVDKHLKDRFTEELLNLDNFFFYKQNAGSKNAKENFSTLLLTSGSTGRSKLVKIDEIDLVLRAKSEIEIFEIKEESHLLNVLSFSHDLGFNQLLTSLVSGATLEVCNTIFPANFYKRVILGGFTHLTCMPSVWIYFLKLASSEENLKISFPFVLTVSGGTLPERELKRLQDIFPCAKWIRTYGQTETFRSLIETDQSYFASKRLSAHIKNVNVFLLSDDMEEVGIGDTGRLYHSGIGMTQGYLGGENSPFVEIDNQLVKTKCVDTGDYFKRVAEHSFEFVGRRDDMIKYSGRRFYSLEIENVVSGGEGIKNCIVFAIEGDFKALKYEHLVVAIETDEEKINELEIRNICAKKLDQYKIPDTFIYYKNFPLTASKKVDRRKIKDEALAQLITK